MPTLTVQIVTGRSWYRNAVGKRFDVVKDGLCFRLLDSPAITIDKNHAFVTAVHYEPDELPEHAAGAVVGNGNA